MYVHVYVKSGLRRAAGQRPGRLDPIPIESAKFETITFTHVSVSSHRKFACAA